MHDKSGFDFTQFVPGFDFLKNLGGAAPAGAAAAAPADPVAPAADTTTDTAAPLELGPAGLDPLPTPPPPRQVSPPAALRSA